MKNKNKILQLIAIALIGLVLIIFLGLNNIAQASNSTKLKSLSIEPGETLVQDSENSMIYRTTVGNNVKSIKVNVVPNDSNSKITIEGNENLEVGTNKVNVKVTASNGESTNYIIYVRRLSGENSEEKIIPNVQENSAKELQNNEEVTNNNEQKVESSNETNEDINEKENEEASQQTNQENNITDSEELNNENESNEESLNNIEDKENNTSNMWFFIIIAICCVAIILILIINKNKHRGKH